MTTMMCTKCEYTMETEAPPETCPSCGSICSFVDATCYTPECGLADHVNPTIFESHREKK